MKFLGDDLRRTAKEAFESERPSIAFASEVDVAQPESVALYIYWLYEAWARSPLLGEVAFNELTADELIELEWHDKAPRSRMAIKLWQHLR